LGLTVPLSVAVFTPTDVAEEVETVGGVEEEKLRMFPRVVPHPFWAATR